MWQLGAGRRHAGAAARRRAMPDSQAAAIPCAGAARLGGRRGRVIGVLDRTADA